MIIDSIKNGIVFDHITAGNGHILYDVLGLADLDCQVALIENAPSKKIGKKDVLKIDKNIDLNLDVIGYIDPNTTINIIENGKIVKKFRPKLPEMLVNVISCNNPRCISSMEQELPQQFRLVNKEKREYRCIYCDSRPKKNN